MESPRTRRILSLSKQRRTTTVSIFDKTYTFGPKPSEVYGFVGSIAILVATVILLIWAYVPELWLKSVATQNNIGSAYFGVLSLVTV